MHELVAVGKETNKKSYHMLKLDSLIVDELTADDLDEKQKRTLTLKQMKPVLNACDTLRDHLQHHGIHLQVLLNILSNRILNDKYMTARVV